MNNIPIDGAVPPATTTAAPRRSFDAWRFFGRYGAILVLVVMIVVVASLEPETFATKDNVINILNQSALAAIIAMGLTFPLVAGEFDLSIGYTASLCGVVACSLMVDSGASIPLAFLIAIAVGAVVGLVNGLVVTVLGVNALVATLGVGTVVIGINYAIAGGLPVTVQKGADAFVDLTLGDFLGVPYPVYVMVILAGVLWVLLNRTVLGQSMQAVGGNPVAARLSGVRVDRVRVIVFVICSMCAAVTGVLLASRTGSAAVDGGDGYLLNAFAAAFFGSAVLRDGQFHIVGTIIGVVTVAVGFNAIALIGLETYWQYLFQGTLLILGVGVGTLARRRAS
jgi:ribose transport system permease protein